MLRSISRRNVIAGAGAAGLAAPMIATKGHAQGAQFRWRMQALWPAGTPYYRVFERFIANVHAATGGRLEIEALPVGSVVAFNESLQALQAGVLDAHYSAPSYYAGLEPALAIMGDLNGAYASPYHPQMWIEYGGGKELMIEAYNRFGVRYVGAVSFALESLISKVPIRTLDDFRGLTIRSPAGVQGEIWQALGVGVVGLSGAEIFTALETNAIELADWTSLSQNRAQGFFQIAKYALFPGFHSCGALDIAVNQRRWDELPADIQAALEICTRDFCRDQIQENDLEDQIAATELPAEGVTIIDLPAEERARFREIASGVWDDWGSRSELAGRALASQLEFMRKLGLL
jgi:TRAP-type mannitol/chloroaromatic compound transport system substrate-binding protein